MSGLNFTRRQFLAAAAATAAFPWLNGCREVKDTPHYQLGYALGKEYRREIIGFLGHIIPELLGYLGPVENSTDLTASEKLQIDRVKAAAAHYGFTASEKAAKSSINWDMVAVGVQTFGGIFAVQEALEQQSPNNYAKILGIADGSLGFLSRDLFFLMQCMEVTGTIVTWGGSGACSAILFSSEITTFGEPVLAKNFDLNPVMRYGHILRPDGISGGVQSLSMTMNMMPGAVSATNGKIAITENWLYGTDLARKYLPASCVIEDAIETCTTTQEVVDHFSATECGGYFLAPVIDINNDMALIQNTPLGKVILRPEDSYFVVTNHHQGVFPDYMQRLLNLLITESTYIRYKRITQLIQNGLSGGGKFSLDAIFAILADHDPEPSDNSICRHADHTITVGSIVMLPASGRVYAALGSPCDTPFEEYTLPS